MKLTKDEARILANALEDWWPRDRYKDGNKGDIFQALSNLEVRLEEFGKDKRRNGRTSMDNFTDLLKRYAKKHSAVKCRKTK